MSEQQLIRQLAVMELRNKEQVDLIKQLFATVKLTNKRVDELENRLNCIAGTVTAPEKINTSLG